jgi:PAS domain S-box-containing protein
LPGALENQERQVRFSENRREPRCYHAVADVPASRRAPMKMGTNVPLPSILRPPVFADEPQTHQAWLLHMALWSMIFAPLPYLLYVLTSEPAELRRALSGVLIDEALGFALLWAMRRGHVRWASRMLVCAVWLLMAGLALTRAGLQSQTYQMGLCLAVVVAGMLLGFRAAFATALVSTLFGLLLLRLELSGWIRFKPPVSSTGAWMLSLTIFPVMAVLQYLAQRSLRRALLLARDSDVRSRTLSEATFEGLMIHDKGVILEANQRFAELFGYAAPSELVGRRGLEFMLAPESRARVQAQMAAGVDIAAEVTGVRRDGSTFCGETQSRRFQYKGCGLRIVAMRDISDRVRAEQERVLFERRMAQIQKLEIAGRLAAGVAHDFNNLLTCIIGNAQLLRRSATLSAKERELLDSLLEAAESAARLDGQLLAMGRQQTVAREVLDLNSLIRGFLAVLTRLLGNSIKLELALGDPLGRVHVDPGQVEQILVNLCINARDAMPDGGLLTIRTSDHALLPAEQAEHPDVAPGPYVRIEVADSGTGMAPEILGRIFEPFFTTKEPGKGTGLGLSTVHGIVSQNAGFVAVESRVGVGSVFAVHFPRWQATSVRE